MPQDNLKVEWEQAALKHNASCLRAFLDAWPNRDAADSLRTMTWLEFQAAARLVIKHGEQAKELLELAERGERRDEPHETFWRAARQTNTG